MRLFKKIISYFCAASFLFGALVPTCSAAKITHEYRTVEFNVLVVGNPKSGKTALIRRLCDRQAPWFDAYGHVDVDKITQYMPKYYNELGIPEIQQKDGKGRPYLDFIGTSHTGHFVDGERIKGTDTHTRYKVTFTETNFDDPNLKDLVCQSGLILFTADVTDPSTFQQNSYIEKEVTKIGSFDEDKKNAFDFSIVLTKCDMYEGKDSLLVHFQRTHPNITTIQNSMTQWGRNCWASSIKGVGIGSVFYKICSMPSRGIKHMKITNTLSPYWPYYAGAGLLGTAVITTAGILFAKFKK